MTARCLLLRLSSCVLILSLVGFASDLKPKRNAQEYRYYAIGEEFSVGVNLLSPEDVDARLATPLSTAFFAVEVAFFPRKGKTVKVNPAEFTLREPDQNRASLPMRAEEVAGTVHRNAKKPKRNVTVYPQVGVGVGVGRTSGGYPNDPYGRDNTRTGVGTSVGVGVGIEDEQQPGGRREDRQVMETELSDHALEEGDITEPVAGMVYFPIGRMKLDSRKILEYRDPAKPASAEPLRIDLTPILGP